MAVRSLNAAPFHVPDVAGDLRPSFTFQRLMSFPGARMAARVILESICSGLGCVYRFLSRSSARTPRLRASPSMPQPLNISRFLPGAAPALGLSARDTAPVVVPNGRLISGPYCRGFVDHKWRKKLLELHGAKETLPRIRLGEQELPRLSERHCSPATMTFSVESIAVATFQL